MSPTRRPGLLERFLTRRVREGWMPGAVWWVEGPDGVPRQGACGDASLEPRREPARLDTVFDLASLTKMLATAPLLVALEQQGRLELEAPFPEGCLPPRRRRWFSHRRGMRC